MRVRSEHDNQTLRRGLNTRAGRTLIPTHAPAHQLACWWALAGAQLRCSKALRAAAGEGLVWHVRWRAFGVVFAALLLVGGCASAPPPKGRPVDARIVASEDVNPDRSGVASPISVRIVQLRSDARFGEVEFAAVFDNPQAALGADFVAISEQVLRPGEQRELALDLRPETEFVGAIAAFQALPDAEWKALVRAPKKSKVPGLGDKGLWIRVENTRVSIGDGKGP